MSSLDPLLSVAAAITAIDSAVADASLNLGVPAEVLQAQLQVGDLLAAVVLAPQGGQDLLSIFGQTVVAQLPPGVLPGQTLLLQVTAFSGNQILVRNLGIADPQNPPPTAQLVLPSPEEGAVQSATLTTIPPDAVPADPPASAKLPAAQAAPASATPQGPVAPSRAVFVAASVQPATLEPPVAARASVPSPERAAPGVGTAPELEARILAARNVAPEPSAAVRATPDVAPARAAGFIAGIRSDPKLNVVQTNAPKASAVPPKPSSAPPIPSRAAPPIAPRVSPPPISPQTPAQRLLAQLRVPATPSTLAAADLATDSAHAVPRALVQLQAVLARTTVPLAAPLKSLVAFIARLDPGNIRALPEQIASYVSNVLDGGESKLVALLQALVKSDAQAGSPPGPSATASGGNPPPQGQAAQPAATTGIPIPSSATASAAVPLATTNASNAQARAVVQAASIDHDLKTVLLALTQSLPEGAPPALTGAINDALVALTAAQLSAMLNTANDPSSMAFALPMFFREGGKPVQLRIAREAPGRKNKLDADNFHIGFVLDTESLGTVAIDLETVGRSVKLDVKTERANAAERFRDELGELRTRLEQLHYNVASARASVLAPAGSANEASPAVPASAPTSDPDATTDRWDIIA